MDRRQLLALGGLAALGSVTACGSGRGDSRATAPITPPSSHTSTPSGSPASSQTSQAWLSPTQIATPATPSVDVPNDAVDIHTGTFRSRHRRGADTPWLLVYPHGHRSGQPLPLLVTLHGTGAGNDTPWVLRWAKCTAQMAREGLPPFACVGVSGGDTWWRARADGTDSAAMITDELLPVLAARGVRTDRFALYGYSMGGYGALHLAQDLGPARVSSVVAASTPFPRTWDELPGAFDSPADFIAHDVRSRWPRLTGIPTRIDIGDHDPFAQDNLRFVPTALPRTPLTVYRGGHDRDFWGRTALDQLRFTARHI